MLIFICLSINHRSSIHSLTLASYSLFGTAPQTVFQTVPTSVLFHLSPFIPFLFHSIPLSFHSSSNHSIPFHFLSCRAAPQTEKPRHTHTRSTNVFRSVYTLGGIPSMSSPTPSSTNGCPDEIRTPTRVETLQICGWSVDSQLVGCKCNVN